MPTLEDVLLGPRCAFLRLATALAAAAPVVAGVPVPVAQGDELVSPSVRVGTYNIVNSASPAEAETAMRRLLPYVDVAGLQEYEPNDRLPSLDRLAQAGWGYWKVRYSDPVIWDSSSFDFGSARAVTVAAGRMVENKATSSSLKYRNDTVAAVVRLVHRATGERLVFINVHPTPGAAPRGRPNRQMPRRLAMYKEEIRATAALAEQEQVHGRVFFVGDWNINYRADVKVRKPAFAFRQFKRVGYRSVWASGMPEIGTQRRSLIDGVWATTRPSGSQILTGFPESDHRPTVVTYPLPTS